MYSFRHRKSSVDHTGRYLSIVPPLTTNLIGVPIVESRSVGIRYGLYQRLFSVIPIGAAPFRSLSDGYRSLLQGTMTMIGNTDNAHAGFDDVVLNRP